jgi:hypothetical protein
MKYAHRRPNLLSSFPWSLVFQRSGRYLALSEHTSLDSSGAVVSLLVSCQLPVQCRRHSSIIASSCTARVVLPRGQPQWSESKGTSVCIRRLTVAVTFQSTGAPVSPHAKKLMGGVTRQKFITSRKLRREYEEWCLLGCYGVWLF